MSEIRPIRRLAIVNRGEAAMRCIRAVKSLGALEESGIKVLALYTHVDRGAPFVRHADEAVLLPSPRGAVQAYLDHDLLIDTLERHHADAVWPGWGFVAEDPSFVERVVAAGIRFLGPSAETMRALGDKISSKLLAEEAEVPVTDWSRGETETAKQALEHADRIGYPVVIKASAGGGGRGIRIVRQREELARAFDSAKAEAIGAFGDGRLFVEAMVQGGRHIEVQIVADEHGFIFALGTRDCSVQRRHQKVLEEGPPTNMAPLVLQAITDSAAELARRVGYVGVGTVEFLVRGAEFFFLEMNPRLQVEHGITERLTGADLVQKQIRIARGEHLSHLAFEERGFAIEARVCAEDPDAGFLPAPGRIARFDPALGPRLRIDTGVASECVVPPDFDSLIAKIIAYGDSREEARARLVTALRDFDLVIEGGATNKGYLLELLEADEYRQGGVDTGWLDRWNLDRGNRDRPYASEGLVLAAILSYQAHRNAKRQNFFVDPGNISPERIPRSVGLEVDLSYEGKSYRVHVFAAGAWRYRVHLDGRVVDAGVSTSGSHAARLVVGGQDLRVLHDVSDSSIRVEVEGRAHRFGRQTAGQVRASAPSLVVNISVNPGDRVEAGAPLGLVEAMKMEIGFDAPVSGTVTEVRVRTGQQVAAGDVLLVIDPASETDDGDSAGGLSLVEWPDPLSTLFTEGEGGGLGKPDLERAQNASPEELQRAMEAVREEVRRILLGYDAFAERVHKLILFLEAPITKTVNDAFREQLVQVKHQLAVFADVEGCFSRRQVADASGELEASNNARLRLYLRRIRAEGAGLPDSFLDNLKRALSHYGVETLEYDVRLERSVMRLFASQLEPALRFRLIRAVLGRVMSLVEPGRDLEKDVDLRVSLERISSLRGQLPDALADAAIQAHDTLFVRPDLTRQAERTTRGVEQWLTESDTDIEQRVLLDLALAPAGIFRTVKKWLRTGDPRRQGIALSACIIRNHAPKTPLRFTTGNHQGFPVTRIEFSDGQIVVAALSPPGREQDALAALLETNAGKSVFACELIVTIDSADQEEPALEVARSACQLGVPTERFTVSTLTPELGAMHHTYRRDPDGHVEKLPYYGLHPEAVRRVDFQRYGSFELQRLPSPPGIYCFHGKAREVPEDERIFVLVDVRGKPPEGGPDARHYVPMVERAFNEATRTLRQILAERDPRRQLQWNRITLFLAHPVLLDDRSVDFISQKLHPTTRHLGLERVSVRLETLEKRESASQVRSVELVISDLTGSSMELLWRAPHSAPLLPVEPYQRSVVAAKRRGLVYPYEIVRMLAPGNDGSQRTNRESGLPLGSFEEFDLDPDASSPTATSVGDRPAGKNKSAIVFGVISTPTRKVPEGMKRVLILSDPTRGMGALTGAECDRIVAAINLAEANSLPVEWVPVSSGARISMSSGTENLDSTARVVRRIVTFTQNRGVIHLIVSGVNVGAQSYWDSLATMLMHTRGILVMTPRASMVLTGRAALAASGSVSAEDEVSIGGYERVMGPNGQAQYYAQDLTEAFRILYEHHEYTYVVPGERGPRRLATTDPPARRVTEHAYQSSNGSDGFDTLGEIFDDRTNPGRKKPFGMRCLMRGLIDQDGGYLERWQGMTGAETAIVWDAHLGGQPICMIGIESQNVPRWGYRPLDGPAEYNGGTLFPQSSRKVARALNAASGNRPVVVLANLSGFDGSPESMRKLQLENGAEIARAVVNFDGPVLFLVVSRYHGGAYVVFSQELNPGLRACALEGSFASVIGGGPASKVVFSREVRARVQSDVRVQAAQELLKEDPGTEGRESLERLREGVLLEKQGEVAAEFDAVHTVQRAKDVGSLEAIIEAPDMRPFLIGLLDDSTR